MIPVQVSHSAPRSPRKLATKRAVGAAHMIFLPVALGTIAVAQFQDSFGARFLTPCRASGLGEHGVPTVDRVLPQVRQPVSSEARK